jgi:hypothetical protein
MKIKSRLNKEQTTTNRGCTMRNAEVIAIQAIQ